MHFQFNVASPATANASDTVTTNSAVTPSDMTAYMTLIADLAAHLEEQGDDGIGNDFALSEFLDRYGIRLNQLGTILSLVGPLAEIAGTTEPKKQQG